MGDYTDSRLFFGIVDTVESNKMGFIIWSHRNIPPEGGIR